MVGIVKNPLRQVFSCFLAGRKESTNGKPLSDTPQKIHSFPCSALPEYNKMGRTFRYAHLLFNGYSLG